MADCVAFPRHVAQLKRTSIPDPPPLPALFSVHFTSVHLIPVRPIPVHFASVPSCAALLSCFPFV